MSVVTIPGVQNPHCSPCAILEGLLQRVQLGRRRRDTFDGRHALAVDLHGKHQAGTRGSAVHEDGARAAHAMLAAHMRPGEHELVPQEIRERSTHADLALDTRCR